MGERATFEKYQNIEEKVIIPDLFWDLDIWIRDQKKEHPIYWNKAWEKEEVEEEKE